MQVLNESPKSRIKESVFDRPGEIELVNSVGTRRQHHHCAAESEGCGHHPLSHSFHNHVCFLKISNLHPVRKDN